MPPPPNPDGCGVVLTFDLTTREGIYIRSFYDNYSDNQIYDRFFQYLIKIRNKRPITCQQPQK